jgi:hypothetical protein
LDVFVSWRMKRYRGARKKASQEGDQDDAAHTQRPRIPRANIAGEQQARTKSFKIVDIVCVCVCVCVCARARVCV